ncbi:unnamed protein product [Rhizoctonia solani]|uniref:Uncharacterized protein n=1 Tax=Rhizoctonia solani TaxID=456999 RepID=A0A8H3D9R5_9AGAM|nr:unnamed protein product [Rhizoctonia solani]CAE6517222.1 unnamed protein product [Rhizoctonia solani]
MRYTCLITLATLASASPLNFELGRRGKLPTPVSVATAKEYLSEIKVAPPVTEPAYNRQKFRHWITIDGKCDTRESKSSSQL